MSKRVSCDVGPDASPGPDAESNDGQGPTFTLISPLAGQMVSGEIRLAVDIQGGGTDLAFPHHEMSASEAQVLTDAHPFARHYVHSAMVSWQGHKMSKSRGNLVFVSALRHAGVDAAAIRLALLAHHYRSEWAWTDLGLEGATKRLALWRMAAAAPSGSDVTDTLARVRALCAHPKFNARNPNRVRSLVGAFAMHN